MIVEYTSSSGLSSSHIGGSLLLRTHFQQSHTAVRYFFGCISSSRIGGSLFLPRYSSSHIRGPLLLRMHFQQSHRRSVTYSGEAAEATPHCLWRRHWDWERPPQARDQRETAEAEAAEPVCDFGRHCAAVCPAGRRRTATSPCEMILWSPPPVDRHSTAQHSTAQYSTAQYSTAQHHSIAQHSTARHITPRHIASHHVTSHHSTSHHITPHHIASHHSTSHHITSSHGR